MIDFAISWSLGSWGLVVRPLFVLGMSLKYYVSLIMTMSTF